MKPEPTSSTAAGQPSPASPHPALRTPQSTIERIGAYRLFWVVAIVTLVLDQLTKQWIVGRLNFPTYGPPWHIEVIPGFFNLVHVGNTGAAWSMFSGYGQWLAGLAVITLFVIFCFRRAIGLNFKWPQLCFGLLCGGTVGNLIDRLRFGHVVDFLDFRFGSYAYPSFNVADAGIVCGVIGYVIWSLRQPATPAGK